MSEVNINNKVVIKTDALRHSFVTNRRDLKYNKLINNRNAAYVLRKNTIVVNNVDINNTIIVADHLGNNNIKNFDECTLEETDSGNIFKDLLLKTRQKKSVQTNFITDYLNQKRDSLQNKLKMATEFHKAQLYEKANEFYKNALDSIERDNYPDEFMLNEYDMIGIKFAFVLTKIEICDNASLKTAEEILISLIYSHGSKLPWLYFYLGKVYYNLFNFKKSTAVVNKGLELLKNVENLLVLNWPGTQENMIEETDKDILEQNMNTLIKESNITLYPDAKCQYELCEIDNTNIYFKSPLFFGYVDVKCSNKCNIAYHKACWKNKLKTLGIKNIKLLLNQLCRTSDCLGYVDSITLFDENLTVVTTVSYSSKGQNKSDNKLSTNINILQTKEKENKKNIKIKQSEKGEQISKLFITDKQDSSSEKKELTKNTEMNDSSSDDNNYKKDFKSLETKVISSNLNSNAKEYVPSLRMIQILKQQKKNLPDECKKFTETHISQKEYDNLKNEVNILRVELFKADESYNILLEKNENIENNPSLVSKTDSCTETDPYCCANCKKYETELNKTKSTFADNMVLKDQLEIKIKQLTHEINELKTARLLDRENFSHFERKYAQEKEVVFNKYQELLNEKEGILKEFAELKHRNEPKHIEFVQLQNILVEQLKYIRSFYFNYITSFENKCRHIIWELEDIKSLTNADSLPSVQEVEENLNMWKQTLDKTIKSNSSVMLVYDQFIKKIQTDPVGKLFPTPIPPLIPEPPSVILRHFKSFFLINKRLEQDLNKHMTNYYKMLCMPYPGSFPVNTSELAFQPNIENKPTPETEVKVWNPPPRPRNAFKKTPEKNAEVKVEENASNFVTENSASSTVNRSLEIKTEIVGAKNLIFKLQQKYPLTPPAILQEAVKIQRNARGGLSGIDSQTLFGELRIIIKDLCKKERQKPGYQKINVQEKPNPWVQINNEIQWQNTNPCGNCAICFEKMNRSNSTLLRCQHNFHSVCVKKWLQTNSICPICRSFTTLDDEFPPLK